jgi:hypothetical protein
MAEADTFSLPVNHPGAGLFADPLTDRIAAFILEIGIGIERTALDAPTACPGVDARYGVLLVDETSLAYPGDLLHDAGHIAVCDPALRSTLQTIGDDPAEEMAAMAWSYAAGRQLGLDPAVVFHASFRGGGEAMIEAFEHRGGVGVPLLEWFGMTLGAKAAAAQGAAPYPHMLRWLR